MTTDLTAAIIVDCLASSHVAQIRDGRNPNSEFCPVNIDGSYDAFNGLGFYVAVVGGSLDLKS